jgi:predicted RNA-binding protein YlqC (UPF0109 family)
MKTKVKPNEYTTSEPKLEKLLRDIVAAISRKTPDPEIYFDESTANFDLKVHSADHGRFVGKHGMTIFALKTIFWYAGLVSERRTVGLNLLEPEFDESVDKRALPFKPKENWDRKLIANICDEIICGTLGSGAGGIIIEETGETSAKVRFSIESYLQTAISEPDLVEALSIVIHAIGMSNGVTLNNEITWR